MEEDLKQSVRVLENEYQVLCCTLRGRALEVAERAYGGFSNVSSNGVTREQLQEHWGYIHRLTRMLRYQGRRR